MPLPPSTAHPAHEHRARTPGTARARLRRALVALPVLTALAGLLASSPAGASDEPPRPAPNQVAVGGWERPVPGAVAHPFDPPAEDWGAGHRGVDLVAATGEPVRSPAGGVVSFSGRVAGKPVVVVTHAGGLRSTFEPVDAGAARGDAVGPGDVVGTLAGTPGHCAPAGCLHWGVLRGDVYLDPLALLGEDAPIVLLPGSP